MRTLLSIAASAAVALGAASAMPAVVNVDLSSWVPTPGGNWNVAADNNSVLQTINGNPTVFHNNTDSQGVQLSGTIEVQTTADDDFIGFVLGYEDGDLGSSSAEYILIDWKQNDQLLTAGVFGSAGLAISKVSGALTFQDAWAHQGNVTELARATNLGSTGWSDNTEYSFDLSFTSNRIRVFVNGNLEIDITGTFSDGAFGFYNSSQQQVRYGALTTQDAPEVPIPAAAFLFAPLLGGLALKRRQK